MSQALSEQMEIQLSESISQISAFAVNENEANEDIYSEPFGVSPGSSSEIHSKNSKAYLAITHLARCLPLLAGHFKMTPKTLKKGKRFLKVFITQLSKLIIKAP